MTDMIVDFTFFTTFHYEQAEVEDDMPLGTVVYRKTEDGEEIGVVIQKFDADDLRTDSFGVEAMSNLKIATRGQIAKLRPELFSTRYKPGNGID